MSDAGRVIAGSARGLRLLAPGPGTRALGDRVKETLFAVLEPILRGATVLDLFAGSGAAGIEALSRGAARAIFVERDPTAARVAAENLRRARLAERGQVVRADAAAYLRDRAAAAGPFDVVIVDPPYAEAELLAATLGLLGRREPPLVGPAAVVVAKHFWRTPPPPQVGLLASTRSRRFGETGLTFYRRGESGGAGETSAAGEPAAEAERKEEEAR